MSENFVQSVRVVQRSEIGSKRDVNQDSVGMRLPSEKQDSQHALFIVADGVGGNLPKGEVASRTAVDALLTYYFNRPDSMDMLERAADALQDTNAAVRNQAAAEAVSSIGTTVVGIALAPNGDIIGFNVGDSRLYRIRDNKIELVSVDQVVQQEPGVLKDEISVKRVTKISSYLGQPTTLEPNFYRLKAQIGDTYLLCTDGIWSKISDQEFLDVFSQNSLEDAADLIVKRVYERGAPDNLSLIGVQLGTNRTRQAGGKSSGCRRPLLILGGIIIAGAVIVGGGAVINSGILAAPTATATATATNTPTATTTPTNTTTPSATPTATDTSSPTATLTPTYTPTATETATETPSPTATNTPTPLPTVTSSYTPTAMPTVTNTPTATPTTTPSSTVTFTAGPPTSTLNPTLITSTPLPTATPTNTPAATFTPTMGPSPTLTLTPSPTSFLPQLQTEIELAESVDFYPITPGSSLSILSATDQIPVTLPAGTVIKVQFSVPVPATGIVWSYIRTTDENGTESSGWAIIPTPQTTPMLTIITGAPLRYGPNGSYDQIRVLPKGETAEILGYAVVGTERWYYVRAMSSGSFGWVWENNAETSVSLDTIPPKADYPPLPPTDTPDSVTPSPTPEATAEA